MTTVSPRGPPMRLVRSAAPSITSAIDRMGTTPPAGVASTGISPISAAVAGCASASTVTICASFSTRPTASRPIAPFSRSATAAGDRCSALVASGSSTTVTSRTSPPSTSTRPTPATPAIAGRITYSPISRSSRGSTWPLRLKVTTGNDPVVIFSTDTSVLSGRSALAATTLAWSTWSARHMSVPGANWIEISAAPRMVRLRMRSTPSTAVSACSRGRVTVARNTSGGASPTFATTTMRGNSTSG